MRAFLVAATLVALLSTPVAAVTHAQTPTPAPATVAGDGAGRYLEAAPVQLRWALDRALAELDAAPPVPTPEQVKSASFRRRILELRLLMDLNAFAYEPTTMEVFREIVDEAYEAIGQYQDLHVTQEITGQAPRQELVDQRLRLMAIRLETLRAGGVREAMRGFFARPEATMVQLTAGQVPLIWTIAGVRPSQQLDGVGNLALLSQAVLRNLQTQGLPVGDIFDPVQEERFHDVRKALRSIMILTDMFSATRDATADARAPLMELVGDYGDVNDLIVAYHAARALGANVEPVATALREEFAEAQAQQQLVQEMRAIQQMLDRLWTVEQSHRR